MDLAVNLASEGVLFMGNGRGILFVKALDNGEALGEGFGIGRGGEGDRLVGWLTRSFPGQVSDEAPKGGRIRRGRGGLDRIRPTRPRGRVDDIVDFAIEASDVRVGRVSAPDRVTLTNERDCFVRDARVERFAEARWNFTLRSGQQDAPEDLLALAARRRRALTVKETLGLLAKTGPVSESEICKGERQAGGRGGVQDGDENGKVIGDELGGCGPGEERKELSRDEGDIGRG